MRPVKILLILSVLACQLGAIALFADQVASAPTGSQVYDQFKEPWRSHMKREWKREVAAIRALRNQAEISITNSNQAARNSLGDLRGASDFSIKRLESLNRLVRVLQENRDPFIREIGSPETWVNGAYGRCEMQFEVIRLLAGGRALVQIPGESLGHVSSGSRKYRLRTEDQYIVLSGFKADKKGNVTVSGLVHISGVETYKVDGVLYQAMVLEPLDLDTIRKEPDDKPDINAER